MGVHTERRAAVLRRSRQAKRDRHWTPADVYHHLHGDGRSGCTVCQDIARLDAKNAAILAAAREDGGWR